MSPMIKTARIGSLVTWRMEKS